MLSHAGLLVLHKDRDCNLPSTQLTWSEHTSNSNNYSVALIEHGGDQLLSIADTVSFGDDQLLSTIDTSSSFLLVEEEAYRKVIYSPQCLTQSQGQSDLLSLAFSLCRVAKLHQASPCPQQFQLREGFVCVLILKLILSVFLLLYHSL